MLKFRFTQKVMDRGSKETGQTFPRIEAGLRLSYDAIRSCVFSVFDSPVYWQVVRFFVAPQRRFKIKRL